MNWVFWFLIIVFLALIWLCCVFIFHNVGERVAKIHNKVVEEVTKEYDKKNVKEFVILPTSNISQLVIDEGITLDKLVKDNADKLGETIFIHEITITPGTIVKIIKEEKLGIYNINE